MKELKNATIVVDIINDFVTGVLRTERAEKIIPRVKRLLEFAREKKIPVIYTCDTHLPGVDNEFEV